MIKAVFISFFLVTITSALSVNKIERWSKADKCDAVVEATFLGSRVVEKKGKLFTLFHFKTVDAIKGETPELFEVKVKGGATETKILLYEGYPNLTKNKNYTLFLVLGEKKFLHFHNLNQGIEESNNNPHQKALDPIRKNRKKLSKGLNLEEFSAVKSIATDDPEGQFVAAINSTDGLILSGGDPLRYIQQDRGEPIPVIPDISTLPSGVTSEQALTALQNALDVWENNTTILFDLKEPETFIQAANDYTSADGEVIRVQFHDNFNDIANNSTTLGIGGSSFSGTPGTGGQLGGQDTLRSLFGFVILDHVKGTLQDLDYLEEVLCHEIGHVIGLAHSSEDENESNSLLADAVMYFQAGATSNGAVINQHDIDTSLKLYPLNPPPYSLIDFNRFLRAVTTGGSLNNPEINQVVLSDGNDLQNESITINLISQSGLNGIFEIAGNIVTYTANGYFNAPEIDYQNGNFYDRATFAFSDETNLSATFDVRIIQYLPDTFSNADGLPTDWVNTHFPSNPNPGFHTDSDGDGLENWEEFRLGTDPNNSTDAAPKITFNPSNRSLTINNSLSTAVYTIESSTDLSGFSDYRYLQDINSTNISVDNLFDPSEKDREFFRVKYSEF